tara:strand:+ start:341 stop:652 length:312 start_codon:yes stop_codon:yes gene_type:complete
MYKILLLFLIFLFLSNCQNVREGLSLKKKENIDEFLIKKKNPLVLPPEFSKLPKPLDQSENENIGKKNDEIDLSGVLKENKDLQIKNENTDLEKSIQDIIKKK